MIRGLKNPTCASCARFPLEASMRSDGVETCAIFERKTGWDYPACVLYEQAGDRAQRREFVLQLRAGKQ